MGYRAVLCNIDSILFRTCTGIFVELSYHSYLFVRFLAYAFATVRKGFIFVRTFLFRHLAVATSVASVADTTLVATANSFLLVLDAYRSAPCLNHGAVYTRVYAFVYGLDRAVATPVLSFACSTSVTSRNLFFFFFFLHNLIRIGRLCGRIRSANDIALTRVLDEVIGTEAIVNEVVRGADDAFIGPFRILVPFRALFLGHFRFAHTFRSDATFDQFGGGPIFVDAYVTNHTLLVLCASHGIRVFYLGPRGVRFPFSATVFEHGVVLEKVHFGRIGETADPFPRVSHDNVAITAGVGCEPIVGTFRLSFASEVVKPTMIQKFLVKHQSLIVPSNLRDVGK